MPAVAGAISVSGEDLAIVALPASPAKPEGSVGPVPTKAAALLESVDQKMGAGDCDTGGDAGDTRASATSVSTPAACTAALGAGDTNDYYAVEVPAGATLLAAVQPHPLADYDICLYDPTGAGRGCSINPFGAPDAMVEPQARGGTWVVRVVAYTGAGAYALAIAVSPVAAPAAPCVNPVGPANDCFEDSAPLAGFPTSSDAVDTTFAQTEPGEPEQCGWGGDPGGATVWWSWTPEVDLAVTATTAASSYDTILAVYSGSSVGGLDRVACNDDYRGLNFRSRVDFAATAGTTYHFQVGGWSADTGIALLELRAPPAPPANDMFASAIALSGFPAASASVDTTSATTEVGEPAQCGWAGDPGGATVWWSWTPSEDTHVQATTERSDYDTILAVYTGSALDGLTTVGCNDDSGYSYASRVDFAATAGTTYHFQVGGWGGDVGSAALDLREVPPPPANDAFADAQAIGNPSTTTTSTASATDEAGEPQPCGGISGTVWYSWTAPASGTIVADTFTSDFDTVLAVYTGSSLSSLALVRCNDDDGSLQSRVAWEAAAGTTYWIQVGGYYGDSGNLVLHLE